MKINNMWTSNLMSWFYVDQLCRARKQFGEYIQQRWPGQNFFIIYDECWSKETRGAYKMAVICTEMWLRDYRRYEQERREYVSRFLKWHKKIWN